MQSTRRPAAHVLLALVLMAFVPACSPEASAPKPPARLSLSPHTLDEKAAPEGLACSFGWKIPSEATVTESIRSKGRSFKVRYKLSLAAASGAEHLLLRKTGYKIISMEGIPAGDPRFPTQAAAQAELNAFPTSRISKAGVYLGIEDFDDFLARLETVLRKGLGADNPRVAQTLRMMRAPQMRPILEQRVGDEWRAWVEVWMGRTFRTGTPESFASERQLGANKLHTTNRIELLGQLAEPAGHANLRLTSTVVNKGGQLAQVFRSIIAQAQRPELLSKVAELPESAAMTNTIEAVLDPATARPQEVLTQRRVELGVEGVPENLREEQRLYRFAW